MRLDGEWIQCVDGEIRPAIHGELLCADGIWRSLEFLVDTGADRTVFSATALKRSKLPQLPPDIPIGGFGGVTETVLIEAQFRFARDDGGKALFRGQFAACTQIESLEMSVLGRDVLDMFALIVDRRADVIAIVGQNHTYTIHRQR
jgi:hypothetical protein